MESLSNRTLIETFHRARQLELDHEFIELIEQEIYRRNLKKLFVYNFIRN